MKDIWLKRAAALLAGGMLGAYLPGPLRIWGLAIIVLLELRLIIWRPADFFGRVFRPEILLLAITFLLGFVYGALAERSLPEPLVLEQAEITGIVEDWNKLGDKAVGTLRVEEITGCTGAREDFNKDSLDLGQEFKGQSYRLLVYNDAAGELPGEWKRVQPGDYVSLTARLERPKSVGTQGAFDLRLYYAVRGLSGTLSAKEDAVIIAAGEPGLIWKIRQQVRSRLETWDSEETGVLEGIFFGDSSRIPEEIQERYKITGVLHVFAASGSNVAFVLGLSWMLLRLFPLQIRIAGTLLLLILYAQLCGGNAPIVRATVLGIAVLLGRLGRGQVAALRWLFFAAAGLFVRNPLIIRDLGFQLSFAAAWGIAVLAPRILQASLFKSLPVVLRSALAGTLAAQAATLPLLIVAFHRLSLVGLPVNVFILFILGSVLEVGLLGVILSFSGVLSAPFFQVSLWLLAGTNGILKALAEFPYADIWVLNPGFLFWLLWYGGMGVILWGKERVFFTAKVRLLYWSRGLKQELREKLFDKVSVGSGLTNYRLLVRWGSVAVLFLVLWSPWNSPKDLEVVLIDVGQGDSILIRTPARQAVLVDAGPRSESFDAGEHIVLPYLLDRGIRHLDALLISHEHQDHLGGVRSVLANIPTDWVGVPDVDGRLDNEEWKEGLPLEWSADSGKLKKLWAGDRIELDSGVWLDVLGPNRILSRTHSDANNNSLIIKLHYLGQSVLLTADMEREEMEEIAQAGTDLEADFFKEPHHGSRFSLDKPVLDGIHPQAVGISVGRNTFGHPAPEVLQYWEERRVPVFRTDEHGTLTFVLNEYGIQVVSGRQVVN